MGRVRISRLVRAAVTAAALAIVATACDPGTTAPAAGDGTAGYGGDGANATAAQLVGPGAIVPIPSGGYLVVDQGACVVRKVNPANIITTLAGTGTCGYAGDGGPATTAEIDPVVAGMASTTGGLALAPDGSVYLGDSGNGRVRRIRTDGIIETVATAPASYPLGGIGQIAIGGDGLVYFASGFSGLQRLNTDSSLSQVRTGTVLALASDPTGRLVFSELGATDGAVLRRYDPTTALTVDLSLTHGTPTALATDAAGHVYAGYGTDTAFSTTVNRIIRRAPDGAEVVVAGTGNPDPASGTQSGASTSLALSPTGVGVTVGGTLLVSSGHVVYRITAVPDLRGCDTTRYHPNANHSGADLSGADLSRCDLTGADFSDANLTGAELSGSNLSGTDLSSTNLTGAELAQVTVDAETTFSGATLTGASLFAATLSPLAQSSLEGVRSGAIQGYPRSLPTGWAFRQGFLIGPRADLADADLSRADLRDVNLSGADLTGADLSGANLTGVRSGGIEGSPATLPTGWDLIHGHLIGEGANLTDADLSGLDLTGISLRSVNLSGAKLSDALLTGVRSGFVVGTPAALPTSWMLSEGYLIGPGADLQGVSFSGASLAGANLTDANLQSATFNGTILTGADLADANLQTVRFSGANLTGANLTDADVQGGKFTDANLTGANLSGADLSGTGFWDTDLTDADLSNLTVSATTGFYRATLTRVDLAGTALLVLDPEALYYPLSGGITKGPDSLPVGWLLTGGYLIGPRANLDGAQLGDVDLTGVRTGKLIGTPAALPAGWKLAGGYLVGPGADLSGAALRGLDLTGVELSGQDLGGFDFTGTNLTGADLSGITVSTNTIFTNATLTGVDLSGTALSPLGTAQLSGVRSGGIVNGPTSLPGGWMLASGYLIGSGANLTGAQLAGVDLTGTRLERVVGPPATLPTGWVFTNGLLLGPGADLVNRNLNYTDCSGVDFSGADLTGTTFVEADLTGANLSGANIATAVFEMTTLTGANLDGLDLSALDLSHIISGGAIGTPTALPAGWDLIRGYFIGPGAILYLADLSGVDLTGMDLTGAYVEGADFTGATLTGVRSGGITEPPAALPQGWSFLYGYSEDGYQNNGYLVGPGADLSGADFSLKDLNGADFSQTNLTNANFSLSLLEGADFTGADLSGANFRSVVMTGADLSGAVTTNTSFWWTTLTGANLDGVDLSTANLALVTSGQITGRPAALPTDWQLIDGYLLGPYTNLSEMDLGGVDLSGVNLSGALGTPSGWATAIYADTTCPDATVVSSPATCAGHDLEL